MTKQATLGLTLTCLVIAASTLPVVDWLTAFLLGFRPTRPLHGPCSSSFTSAPWCSCCPAVY